MRLLLLGICLAGLSIQGPVVTEDSEKIAACNPGHTWVDNYIKYSCYEDGTTKGIAVVGCAPKNDMTSEVLLPWQTHTTCHFKYVCEMNETHASYRVKTCMDRTGAVLKVGMSRSFDDGESVTCFEEDGKIRLRITTKQGCIVGKAIYAQGHTWIEQTKDAVQVTGRSIIVSSGVSWQCKKDANGAFYSQAMACLSSENRYVMPDTFGMVNGIVVKCSIRSDNTWHLEQASDAEISCSVDGKSIKNGIEWKTADGKTIYVCHFGVVVKQTCVVDGEPVPIHTVRYVGDVAYYCHAGDGIFGFGNLKGCDVSGGRLIKFDKTYYEGDSIMKCSFNFTAHSTAVARVEQVGCLFNKEEISVNAMQLIDGHYIYCARKGDGYVARQLTAEEIAIWLKMGEKSYSRELDGVEGEGTGAHLNKPTTTTTTTTSTTTTTPRPTTTTTTTTTTTPKPTTTTTTTTTTTPRPTTTTTTTTTTTPKPSTTTTTTQAPKTTKKPPPPLPITMNCHDYLEPEICGQLTPLCMSTAAKIVEIRKIVNTAVKAKDQKTKLNNLLNGLGIDEEEEEHPVLFGAETEGSNGCGTCNNSCPRQEVGGCRRQRRLVRELVRFTCPKSCGCPAGYTSQKFAALLLKQNGCKCKCC